MPNKEDAEDIAQEVFLEVYKSIGKFKENSKFFKEENKDIKTLENSQDKIKPVANTVYNLLLASRLLTKVLADFLGR